MSIRDVVTQLIADGVSVIPIPENAKKATVSWGGGHRFSPDDFEPDSGIAIETGQPSGGRVCVDFDDGRSVLAGRRFFSDTAMEGRPSHRDSHRWYLCPTARYVAFKHLKVKDPITGKEEEKIILELRATGQYAVIPPSGHPSGEKRSWSSQTMLDIEFEVLRADMMHTAIAVLLSHHFSGAGSRHYPRLHLAGYLKSRDLKDATIRRIGHAVMDILKSDHVDWDRACDSTFGKPADEHVTGGPSLAKELDRGEEVIARIDKWLGKGKVAERRVRLTRATDIKTDVTDWLWEDSVTSIDSEVVTCSWMPVGCFGIVSGREETGKSSMLIDCAARLTRGTLPGIYFGTPKSVLIAASEDSWAHILVPRLVAANADLQKVYRVDTVVNNAEDELTLPSDVAELQKLLIELKDVALLILDPLMSRLSSKLNSDKDAQVRQALEPLVRLADATRVTIIGIIHVNKSKDVDLLTAVMGSRAFTAVSRFVLGVAYDPNREDLRLMGMLKCNIGQKPDLCLMFVTEGRTFTADSGKTGKTSAVEWKGHVPQRLETIIKEAHEMTKDSAGGEATRWLKQYLTDHGETASSVVKEAAEDEFISKNALKTACKILKIKPTRTKTVPSTTSWKLPVTP